MITLLVIFNFIISVVNAWAVGRSWVETKAVGGWVRFMSWMGATMSAVGFSWCYLVLLAITAGPDGFNKLPKEYVAAMFSLGYLVILIPLLGSGLAITIDAWAYFWRKKTFGNAAIAGFNTFADVYNIYQATKYVPTAWDNVKDLLFSKKSKSDSDNAFARIAITLAILAVIGGALTSAVIIRSVAEFKARQRLFEVNQRPYKTF